MRGMMGERHDMNRKPSLPQWSHLVTTVRASWSAILVLSITAVRVLNRLMRMIRSRAIVVSIVGTASIDWTMVELIHLRLRSTTTVHIGVSCVAVHVGIFGCNAGSVHVAIVVVVRGGAASL